MEKIELTKEEYKQLVIDVAIKISPKIVDLEEVKNSEQAGNTVALYARDIAMAVDSVLKDWTGNTL